MPSELAGEISAAISIPTIGIGAGPLCDGQVLVTNDALGLNPEFTPRFLRRFADLNAAASEGIEAYARAVREGAFPGPEHGFSDDT